MLQVYYNSGPCHFSIDLYKKEVDNKVWTVLVVVRCFLNFSSSYFIRSEKLLQVVREPSWKMEVYPTRRAPTVLMVLISLYVHQDKDSGQFRKIQVCEHGVIMLM